MKRTYKLLIVLTVIFFHSQIILAEEPEKQNSVDLQKLVELQKLLDMQKLMEMQQNSEVMEFRNEGFNRKHYQIAKRLNLDVENYRIYNTNRKNRKKGNRLMAIGGGIATIGFFLVIDGLLTAIEPPQNSKKGEYDTYYLDNVATGGVGIGTGIGLLIGGVIKRNKIRDVVTKDGKQLNLLLKH